MDLCTGVGAIAAVLARAQPAARVVATDIDEVALRCARRNGVEARLGHLEDPLPRELEGRVDVLTAVVPYVPTRAPGTASTRRPGIEPRRALDGGVEGTDVLVAVARRSTSWLPPGGWLLLELGGDQARGHEPLLDDVGFADVNVMTDEASTHARSAPGSTGPDATSRSPWTGSPGSR